MEERAFHLSPFLIESGQNGSQKTTESAHMRLPTVLIFEQDPEMLELLREQVRDAAQVEILTCLTLGEALSFISQRAVYLVIAGSRVSDSGLQGFLEQLDRRKNPESSPSVLVISDPSEHFDFNGLSFKNRIQVLHKPFDRVSLISKVREFFGELLKPGAHVLRIGGLSLDPRSYDVHLLGQRIHLTLSEFRLLQELMANSDQVLSREHLIQKVQGEGIAVIDRAIDTHVFSLRKKLFDFGTRIETVRGTGYRLSSHEGDGFSQEVKPGQT